MSREDGVGDKAFDPAEYLDDVVAIAAYIEEVLEIGDPAFIAEAHGVVARTRGIADIASVTGCERLYKALNSEGNPEFATVMRAPRAIQPSPLGRHRRRDHRSPIASYRATPRTVAARRPFLRRPAAARSPRLPWTASPRHLPYWQRAAIRANIQP